MSLSQLPIRNVLDQSRFSLYLTVKKKLKKSVETM